MANVVIPKPLSSGSLEYPDAPQEGQPEIPEGFEPVSSSPEIPEGFEPVSKPVSPVQTAKPSPGIVDTIKGLGNRADDAITHSMEPKQGEGIGTAMGKTLGREVYSGAKAIPGMVTGLYDAVAAPESDEEKKVNKAQGFQEGDLGSKVSNAIGRVITDPIAVAGKWYKDAFTGKAGPDPLGDALSVAPEAIGSAAGNVIGGAAAHELAPAVKQGTIRALKADESNGMQGFRGNGMPKVQLVDPKLTKAAIEEGRASKVPTTVKSPAELAISEGRASKLPTTKKTPMGSALAPIERDATANPKNFPEYAGEDYGQSLPVERDATKLNEEHAGEDRGPMGSAIERDATMNPKNVPEYAGEERPMGSAIERDATKQNVEHAGEDYSPLERERDATLNKRNIPENAGENFGEKEITPEEVSKSRENVSKSPKDLLSKLIGKDDADQFSLPEETATAKEPEYKWPDTTVDNKANAQAKAELGLTDEKNLTQEQLDKISTRGQEIKNELNGKTAEGEAKPTTKGIPEVSKMVDDFNESKGRQPVKAGEASAHPNAQSVADAYDKMEHTPDKPEVKRSYDSLKNDVNEQWNHAVANGMEMEPWDKEGQPYKNSKEMADDVANNKHLYFFKGGDIPLDHPMAEVDPETGLTANDKFRAVHDLYGHAAHGYEFGPKGEEGAYNVHAQTLSPESIPALTAETRGQNNWVNFGKHMRDAAGNLLKKGDEGYLAPSDRPYAQQKAGLMPEEFLHDPNDLAKSTTYAGEERRATPRSNPLSSTELQEAMKQRQPVRTPFDDTQGSMDTIEKDKNMPKLPGKEDTTPKTKEGTTEKAKEPSDDTKEVRSREDDEPAVKTKVSELSNDNLKKTIKAVGLDPDDYDFAKREPLHEGGQKHPVERYKAVDDVMSKLTDEQVAKIGDQVSRRDATGAPLENVKNNTAKAEAAEGALKHLWEGEDKPLTEKLKGKGPAPEATSETARMSDEELLKKGFTKEDIEAGLHLPEVGGGKGTAATKAPITKELLKTYGKTDDPLKAGFITPDGDLIKLQGEHDGMVTSAADKAGVKVNGKAGSSGPREQFINNENVIRTRYRSTRAGNEVVFSIPEHVTEDQLKQMRSAVGQMGRYGNVVIEQAKPGGLSYSKEFALGSHVTEGVEKLGASPVEEPGIIPEAADKHLTEGERNSLRSDVGRKNFVSKLQQIPDVQEFADIALKGEGGRKWYQRSGKAFDALAEEAPRYFQEGDRDKFTDFVSALSPRQTVTMNLKEALGAWTKYVDAGRPTGAALEKLLNKEVTLPGGKVPNAMKALAGEDLWPDVSKSKAFKVPNFSQNLRGMLNAVTNDGWQGLFAGLSPSELSNPSSYHPISVATRAAAKALGWEPAEAQAAIWAFTKAFTEHGETDPHVVRDLSQDFADIMRHDPEVRDMLGKLGVDHGQLDAKLEAIGEKPAITGRTTPTSEDSVGKLGERVKAAGRDLPAPKDQASLDFTRGDEGRGGLSEGSTDFNPEELDVPEFGKKKPPMGSALTKTKASR